MATIGSYIHLVNSHCGLADKRKGMLTRRRSEEHGETASTLHWNPMYPSHLFGMQSGVNRPLHQRGACPRDVNSL